MSIRGSVTWVAEHPSGAGKYLIVRQGLNEIEVILGPLWVWLSRGEEPGAAVLTGGMVVVAALAVNEGIGLAAERRALRRSAMAR